MSSKVTTLKTVSYLYPWTDVERRYSNCLCGTVDGCYKDLGVRIAIGPVLHQSHAIRLELHEKNAMHGSGGGCSHGQSRGRWTHPNESHRIESRRAVPNPPPAAMALRMSVRGLGPNPSVPGLCDRARPAGESTRSAQNAGRTRVKSYAGQRPTTSQPPPQAPGRRPLSC